MASLLSSWSFNLQSLPATYVVPAEKRPGKPAPISKDIQVIDLGNLNRGDLVQKIIQASQEFGLFQVINHGVPEMLMIDTDNIGKEFFSMATEENETLSSADDAQKGWKLYTSSGSYIAQDFKYWKDTLEHSVILLRLASKLGLIIQQDIACPDPSSALGVGGHYDGNLITILQQDVYGLQLFKDGQWLGVEPLSNAFVINIAFALEVISNGTLKSAMHRVVTNSDYSRTSLASFVNFPFDKIIEPAKSVVSPSNPPVFRGFQFKEFFEVLFSKNSNMEATFEYFKINSQASK
ncbi:hypothetical protein ACH5RR_021389 [Cinchona calisaya]|uniref:Fe2OG dioxygenase domain-containing protein n=1 Tax=Cinchona calisaya TaxID=153742 RepID=A0ABD2ZKE8_9GENT